MDNLKPNPLHPTHRPRVRALYYGQRMARTVKTIALSHPEIAEQIRAEMEKIQNAQHRKRMLLARYRIAVRRVPVLQFPQRG